MQYVDSRVYGHVGIPSVLLARLYTIGSLQLNILQLQLSDIITSIPK